MSDPVAGPVELAEPLFCVVNGGAYEDDGIRFTQGIATAELPTGEKMGIKMPLAGMYVLVSIGGKQYRIDLEPLVTQVAEEHMARSANHD